MDLGTAYGNIDMDFRICQKQLLNSALDFIYILHVDFLHIRNSHSVYPGGMVVLLEIFRCVYLVVVLLPDAQNDRTVFLFRLIIDLVFDSGTIESYFVMLDFVMVDLQRLLFAVAILRFLGKDERLENTRSLYTLHDNTSFSARYITAEICGQ